MAKLDTSDYEVVHHVGAFLVDSFDYFLGNIFEANRVKMRVKKMIKMKLRFVLRRQVF